MDRLKTPVLARGTQCCGRRAGGVVTVQCRVAAGLVVLFLAGCAVTPAGPTVLVLPGTGKPFDQFQADDAACRSWALQQVGGVTPGGHARNWRREPVAEGVMPAGRISPYSRG